MHHWDLPVQGKAMPSYGPTTENKCITAVSGSTKKERLTHTLTHSYMFVYCSTEFVHIYVYMHVYILYNICIAVIQLPNWINKP